MNKPISRRCQSLLFFLLKGFIRILASVIIILLVIFVLSYLIIFQMPGRSYQGPLPALSPEESFFRKGLEEHVRVLAAQIGQRNQTWYHNLELARQYIKDRFQSSGYQVLIQEFVYQGQSFHNLEAVLPGTTVPERSLVIGAHYDTVIGSPGANDNASGVAALLELAGVLRGHRLPLTVRFVAFVNEEPPYFNLMEGMGSLEYVKAKQQAGNVVAGMISLETIGYFSDRPGSQAYPPFFGLFYPRQGNFLGFVGNLSSRSLVRTAIRGFRLHASLPSEGVAAPAIIPGISWSDHRSFWQSGLPAIMITDTAPFRYPHYHLAKDTPDKLDYDCLARVVAGLKHTLIYLAERL